MSASLVKLGSPVTINGLACSHKLIFDRTPNALGSGFSCYSATRVLNQVLIVADWGLVGSHIPNPSNPSLDLTYQSQVGGNVVATPEPLRFYTYNSGRNHAGGDPLGLVAGDCLISGGYGYRVDSCAAFASAPSAVSWQAGVAPGVPPRGCQAVTNFADGGTDVNANKANWRDTITIADPNGTFAASPGTAFTTARPSLWSAAPALHYRHITDADSVWADVGSANYRADLGLGVFYLSSAWIAGLAHASGYCFRASGSANLPVQLGNARHWEELLQAAEAHADGWRALGVIGGSGGGMSGSIFVPTVTYDQWSCNLDGTRALSGMVYGHSYETFRIWGNLLETYSKSAFDPEWVVGFFNSSPTSVWEWGGSILDCRDSNHSVVNCGSEAYGSYTAATDARLGLFNPFGGDAAATAIIQVGCPLGSYPYFATFQAGFSADASPITLDDLGRMPAGTTCPQAFARVKFDGLVGYSWQFDQQHDGATGASAFQVYVNGVLCYDSSVPGLLVTPPDYSATSLPVSIALMGRRRNSTDIELIYGTTVTDAPRNEWRSIGGGIPTTATDGLYAMVDVTGLVSAMLSNYNGDDNEYMLLPTVGQPTSFSANPQGYLESLLPVASFTLGAQDPGTLDFSWELSQSGTFFRADSFSVAEILAQLSTPEPSRGIAPWNRPALPVA